MIIKERLLKALFYSLILTVLVVFSGVAKAKTPKELKVAYVGDQGVLPTSIKVLRLVKNEDAKLLVLLGDLDYVDKPELFEKMMNRELGEKFPYFYIAGNHDVPRWNGKKGYQERLKRRLKKQGIDWTGKLGVKSKIEYKGLSFLLMAPGVFSGDKTNYSAYIKDELSHDRSPWRICLWHKNQAKMQAGNKGNETGWDVYEACRKTGAMILSGHAHSYSRTYPLTNMLRQKVAKKSKKVVLKKGQTISIVSGLGGYSLPTYRLPDDPWWASLYKSEYGALFCTYFADKDPLKASCYFKNIKGKIVDRFEIKTEVKAGR